MKRSDEISQAAASIQSAIDEMGLEIITLEGTLKGLYAAIGRHETLADTAAKQQEEAEKQFSAEKTRLEKKIAPLKAELHTLELELGAATSQKSELKIENIHLHTQNTHFKEYEAKAWKILKAKEAELLERENVLKQKENLRPQSDSLLPPIN